MGRNRGRPPEVVQRQVGQGLPLGLRPGDLQPTSRAILQAAQHLLVTGGIKSVTLAGVAREAHVDVTTVSYHFATREGLIEALMDSLYATPVADLVDTAKELPDVKDRWHAYLVAVRAMYGLPQSAQTIPPDTQAYFEIATYSLRKASLRARLARLQEWKLQAFLDEFAALGLPAIAALGELIFAAIDGIELHRAIAGEDYPIDEVLTVLERLVRSELD